MTGQLSLPLHICPSCGSKEHHGCGYDPDMVRPAMTLTEAVGALITDRIQSVGWDEAKRQIPGLYTWGEERLGDLVRGSK